MDGWQVIPFRSTGATHRSTKAPLTQAPLTQAPLTQAPLSKGGLGGLIYNSFWIAI
jgi:hypothetical protein